MSFVLTFVAAEPHSALGDALSAHLGGLAGVTSGPVWLAPGQACDFLVGEAHPIDADAIRALRTTLAPLRVDVFAGPADKRRKKLLCADMESTMVAFEALEEIGQALGIHDRIKAITARAMNGEIGFRESLFERVGLLRGIEERVLQTTCASMLGRIMPDAQTLVATMRAHGAVCVLATGGFTYFSDRLAAVLGFDHAHANRLDIVGGRLTGGLLEPLLDNQSKRDIFNDYCQRAGHGPEEGLAVGDGANDIPMLLEAQGGGGLGIGYRPKPKVAQVINNLVLYGDLTALLYAQGYHQSDFAEG